MIKIREKNTVSIRAIKVFISISWLKRIVSPFLSSYKMLKVSFLFHAENRLSRRKVQMGIWICLHWEHNCIPSANWQDCDSPCDAFPEWKILKLTWCFCAVQLSLFRAVNFYRRGVFIDAYILKSWPCCNINF
jgi:hypothetical protein